MYLIVSIIIFLISYFLFKKASGSLDIRRLNMGSYVFFILIIFTFFGSVRILYQSDELFYFLYTADEEVIFYGWLGVMYALIMLPVGMIMASVMFRINSMKSLVMRYQAAPQTGFINNEKRIKLTLHLFSIISGLAVIYIYYSLQETLPLMSLLKGIDDYTFLYQQRSSIEYIKLGESRLLSDMIGQIANYSVIMTYVSYAYWKKEGKLIDLAWFVSITIFSMLIAVYATAKGPLLFLFLGLILLHIMIKGGVKLSFLINCGIALLVFIVLLFIYFQGFVQSLELDDAFSLFLKSINERIFVGQVANFYNCLQVFPNVHPHLLFSTTGRLIHEIFSLNYLPDYGVILMSIADPIGYRAGTSGHATTFFMGEAWANFGIVGILVAPLYVGFFIQIIHIIFLKSRKTPVHLALYVYLTWNFTLMSSLKGFYYPAWIVQCIGIMMIILLFASLLKVITIRNPSGFSSKVTG